MAEEEETRKGGGPAKPDAPPAATKGLRQMKAPEPAPSRPGVPAGEGAAAEAPKSESPPPTPEKPAGGEAKPSGEEKPKPVAKPAAPAPAPRPKTQTDDVKALLERFPAAFTHLEDTDPKIPTVLLGDPSLLRDVATFLQKERGFEHLALITSVDTKQEIEVIYNFWSYSKNVPFEVKVRVPRDAPKVPSLTPLWAGANWHERENYDLMGVVFEGHPDLRRILLPEGWEGHPLRKDYEWKKEQYVALDPVTGEDVVYPEQREGSW